MDGNVKEDSHHVHPVRMSINEFLYDYDHTQIQAFELAGLKFEARCLYQGESAENVCYYEISIVCNEKSFNNLWKCSAIFEVQDKIIEFVFDCYHKKLLIKNLLLSESTPITLKTKVEDVVGYQPVPRFDFEVSGFSDVTFLVDEKRVYGHKSILATNSTYFSAMFLSSFAEKVMTEIRLENVNSDEFIEFLNVLYPTSHEVTENNVECLLRVADMYNAGRVLRKCEKFLATTGTVKLSKKLDYAERYRLEDLERTCFRSFKSSSDVINMLKELPGESKEEQLSYLTITMQTKILERYAEVTSSSTCYWSKKWKTIGTKDEKIVENKFEEWNDTVLKIEDVEFSVNRAYLSIFSSYFRELFYENATTHSFELEDVKCDDFLEFSSYIYEPDRVLTGNTIDNITSLSVRFGVPYLLSQCKNYWIDIIQESRGMDRNRLLNVFHASEKFGFSEVQEQMLTRMKNNDELGKVMSWSDFDNLSPTSRLAILRRYFIHTSRVTVPILRPLFTPTDP